MIALTLAPAFAVHAAAQELSPASEQPASVGTIISTVTGVYSDGTRTLRLAPMPCGGHAACLYAEFVERGGEREPERQMVWALDSISDTGADVMILAFPPRREGTFRTNLGDLAVGLWAAPMRFPTIDLDQLVPLGRARLAVDGSSWSLAADDPMLVHRDGARAMTLRVAFDVALSWKDETFDATGARLAGLSATLKPAKETAPITVTPEGLVMVDLRMGRGVELEAGDSALINYDVIRFNGQLVDSTWLPDRHEQHLQPAPGNFFQGFREGVLGMRATDHAPSPEKRHLRRLVIPPTLAFGSRGRAPLIGADEPLIVDLELLTLRKKHTD